MLEIVSAMGGPGFWTFQILSAGVILSVTEKPKQPQIMPRSFVTMRWEPFEAWSAFRDATKRADAVAAKPGFCLTAKYGYSMLLQLLFFLLDWSKMTHMLWNLVTLRNEYGMVSTKITKRRLLQTWNSWVALQLVLIFSLFFHASLNKQRVNMFHGIAFSLCVDKRFKHGVTKVVIMTVSWSINTLAVAKLVPLRPGLERCDEQDEHLGCE